MNLRDRIAVVLSRTVLVPLSKCDAEVLADAVIAALGLKQQDRYGFHRCVSEWEPDEPA